jgi:predicted permease
VTALAAQFGQIFYTIVLPILILVGVGWLLERTLRLDVATLGRLNFYFTMPALIYFSLVTSSITADMVAWVVAFVLGCMAVQALVTWLGARLRGAEPDLTRAMMMTTMFNNSGNYGLPLQRLTFGADQAGNTAVGYQVFVMLTQNFSNFTLGILLAAGGKKDRHWRENLRHVAKFPPLYALAAALVSIGIRWALGGVPPALATALAPLWKVVVWVKEAFLAVALLTLGAQLALVRREAGGRSVTPSVVLRLVGGPLIAVGVILGAVYAFGLEGLILQVLLISAATPTAVNTMLLCLEFDNNPNYAARAVFHSTLLSPITVTLVVFLARAGFLPGFS